jgi:hypothetical protein
LAVQAGERIRLRLANPATAGRHEIMFSGGAMGGMGSARYDGQETGIRALAGMGKVWAINATVASKHETMAVVDVV